MYITWHSFPDITKKQKKISFSGTTASGQQHLSLLLSLYWKENNFNVKKWKNWVLVLLKCNEFNTSACQEISISLALIVWSIFEENDKKNFTQVRVISLSIWTNTLILKNVCLEWYFAWYLFLGVGVGGGSKNCCQQLTNIKFTLIIHVFTLKLGSHIHLHN